MVTTTDVLGSLAAPPAIITPPPLTLPALSLPQLARFLIDEEAGNDPTDGRWQAGVTFRREPYEHAGVWVACGTTPFDIADDCDNGDAPPVLLPFFTTYASRSPLDNYQAADYRGRAERGLKAHEWWQVEKEYWEGVAQPTNPFLMRAAGLTGAGGYDAATPGAAVGLREGFSRLEAAIAEADVGLGVIHVTPFMLESLVTTGGLPVSRENGRIVTVNGNWVIPGNGYTGVGPDAAGGPSADIQWVFATDMTYLLRGTIQSIPLRYPTDWQGGVATSDFVQSLVDAGTQVPMAAQWVAYRAWLAVNNGALRAGIKINATVP